MLGNFLWYHSRNSTWQVALLKDYSKVAATWPKSKCFKLKYGLAVINYHLALSLSKNTEDGYFSMGNLLCSHNLQMQIMNTFLHPQ